MGRKIIGNTVGTPIKPQVLIEKTEQAQQIEQNKKDIETIKKDIKDAETLLESI